LVNKNVLSCLLKNGRDVYRTYRWHFKFGVLTDSEEYQCPAWYITAEGDVFRVTWRYNFWVTTDNILKTVQDRRCYYKPLTGSDIMANQIETIPTTLSDLRRHSPIASLFKSDFSYSCAVFDKISHEI